jgi:tetratricopeptide (TPR) repeat protein
MKREVSEALSNQPVNPLREKSASRPHRPIRVSGRRAVDVKQVGRELGVRYVLEGSLRKAANRVRITGQLVETVTGARLWAERFDGGLSDIFDLQDQVTESVVGAIAPAVEKAEIERAKRKPTESLDAYTLYLRGLARFYQFGNRQTNDEALRLFNSAIELDPDFASAYGRAALCYVWAKTNSWFSDTPNEIAEVTRLAQRAVKLGRLAASGFALAFIVRDLGVGGASIDRALVLNSNLAEAWYFGGWAKIWLGEPEPALERFARGMRLSPLDPRVTGMRAGTAHAHFLLSRYDEAASWAAMALQENPRYSTSGLNCLKAVGRHRVEDVDRLSIAVIDAGKLAPYTLHRRGLRGVKLVISDAHEGIRAAVSRFGYAI